MKSVPENIYLNTCSTILLEAQSASLHPGFPQGRLKIKSCSSTGFSLPRGRQQNLCCCSVAGKCSWQVPICRQYAYLWTNLLVFFFIPCLILNFVYLSFNFFHNQLLVGSMFGLFCLALLEGNLYFHVKYLELNISHTLILPNVSLKGIYQKGCNLVHRSL